MAVFFFVGGSDFRSLAATIARRGFCWFVGWSAVDKKAQGPERRPKTPTKKSTAKNGGLCNGSTYRQAAGHHATRAGRRQGRNPDGEGEGTRDGGGQKGGSRRPRSPTERGSHSDRSEGDRRPRKGETRHPRGRAITREGPPATRGQSMHPSGRCIMRCEGAPAAAARQPQGREERRHPRNGGMF